MHHPAPPEANAAPPELATIEPAASNAAATAEPPHSEPVPSEPVSQDVIMDSIATDATEEKKPIIVETPEPALLNEVPPPIGDLEPPLDILDLLVSEEAIRHDTSLIMTTAPIESLLNYELPLIRPPAPPPPPLPAPPQKFRKLQRAKPKIDRKTAIERKKQERKQALDASPGFRAPRTRAAMAAAAAFEAEATGGAGGSGTQSQTPEADEFVAGPSSSGGQTPASDKPRRGRKSAADKVKDVPIAVEDVDSRQSFKMFEVGWILPAEQRRGGRAPLERGPVPPPRKRAKHCTYGSVKSCLVTLTRIPAHDKSRLSNVSPAPPSSDSLSASVEGPKEEPPAPGATVANSTEASSATDPPGEADPPGASPPRLEGAPQGAVRTSRSDAHVPPERSPVSAGRRTSPSPQPDPCEDPAAAASADTGKQPSEVPASQSASALDASAGEEPAMDAQPTNSSSSHDGTRPANVLEVQRNLVPEPVDKVSSTPEPQLVHEPIMLVDVQAAMPVSDQRVTSPVPMEVDAVATGPDEHGEEEPRAVSIDRDATEPLEDPSVDPLRDPETPALVIGSLAPVPVKGSQAMLETEPTQMSAPEFAPTSQDEVEAGTTAVSGHAPAPEAAPPGTSPQPTSKKVEEKAKEEGKTPRKIIWIETLDTPATRREKYRRLKAEKQAMLQRAAAEAAAAERRAKGLPSPEPESAPVAGPSQSQKQRQAVDAMDVDDDSDLTDLSDLESDEESIDAPAPPAAPPPPPPPKPVIARRWKPPPPDEPGVINLGPGEKVEGGTLGTSTSSYPSRT